MKDKKTATLKVTLVPETKQKLERLARDIVGGERGYMVRFFEKLARDRIVFMDSNLKQFLEHVSLKSK